MKMIFIPKLRDEKSVALGVEFYIKIFFFLSYKSTDVVGWLDGFDASSVI